MKTFRVSCQGMDIALIPNGSFDTAVIGDLDKDQMYDCFKKFLELKVLSDTDLCPPSLYISSQGKDYIFYRDAQTMVCENFELPMTPMEAVNLFSGTTEKPGAENEGKVAVPTEKSGTKKTSIRSKGPVWGTAHPDVRGMNPVRKHELPPTDKHTHTRFTISTSPGQPHVAIPVYASKLTPGFAKALLAFSTLCFVLALGLLATGENAGMIFAAAGFVMGVSGFKLKGNKTLLRIGFDWNANALWIKKDSDKEAAMLGNANCITEFCTAAHDEIRSSKQYLDIKAHLKNPMMPALTYSYTEKSYFVLAIYSNQSNQIVAVFNSEKEAQTASSMLKRFLSQVN